MSREETTRRSRENWAMAYAGLLRSERDYLLSRGWSGSKRKLDKVVRMRSLRKMTTRRAGKVRG
jgi:hypothetical protein